MTACIDPAKGRINVHRSDPEVRLQDYLEGLRFWLLLDDEQLRKIVFVDNSGYPLAALAEAAKHANPHGKDVEFITLNANTYPEATHYGYAELGMVDHAMAASKLLSSCTHFIKANGRLSFPGVSRLLSRLPEHCLFAVDSRNTVLFSKIPQVFVTTQLMIFSTSFYKAHLVDAKAELGQHESHIETLMYRKLTPFRHQADAVLRWPVNVAPKGMAAHWEKNYQSTRQRAVNLGRALCRIVFPNWWV